MFCPPRSAGSACCLQLCPAGERPDLDTLAMARPCPGTTGARPTRSVRLKVGHLEPLPRCITRPAFTQARGLYPT